MEQRNQRNEIALLNKDSIKDILALYSTTYSLLTTTTDCRDDEINTMTRLYRIFQLFFFFIKNFKNFIKKKNKKNVKILTLLKNY